MPRPGPRPYECVRRAWHSDRHQPIRGSLIKEIFRIANEVHSPETKKNKEWQEKLPIVVLKAEEIMYSKANSEEEYMDPRTLVDRVNDAVDTIIRRDETTETDTQQFLQPCIEAALHLGCVPRRATRSQRNCNPRFYLNGNTTTDRSSHIIPSINYNPTCPLNPNSTWQLSYPYSPFLQEPPTKQLGSHIILHNGDTVNGFSSSQLKSWGVYPLYYDMMHSQTVKDEVGVRCDDKEDKEIRIGSFPCNEEQSSVSGNLQQEECDLSLRLAPLSVSARAVGVESIQPRDKDSGSDHSIWADKRVSSVIPMQGNGRASVVDHEEVGDLNVESMKMRKRKAIHLVDGQRFYLQSKHPCSCSTKGTTIAGPIFHLEAPCLQKPKSKTCLI